MEKSRPYVILSAAITLDGKIATKSGDSKISSFKDKKRVHKLRSKVDAILIGTNTLKRDDPLLTVRYSNGKNPIRIILDSNGTISSKSKILRTCKSVPTILVVSKNISKKNLSRLQKFDIQIIFSGEKKINVKKLLKFLEKQKIKKLLVEGGGAINWEFVKHGLVNEAILTLGPYLVGGIEGISLIQGEGFSRINKSLKLHLKKVERYGDELVLYYFHL